MRIEQNVCSKMWTDTNIDFKQKTLRHCCKQELQHVSIEEIKKLGKNVFEKYEQNLKNRYDMLFNNTIPDSCRQCKGEDSIRHVWNIWDDERVNRLRDYLMHGTETHYIELDLGISCNLACIYCGPWSSTMWAKELGLKNVNSHNKHAFNKRLDPKIPPVKFDTYEEEWDYLIKKYLPEWVDTLKKDTLLTLNLLGGEPLMMPETYEIIEDLIPIAKKFEKKPQIMITTNLATKPIMLERMLKLLDDTKDVFAWHFAVSIEDIGHRAELVRYHMKWDNFMDNLKQIKPRVDYLLFTNTLSIVSYPYFHEWLDWVFDEMQGYNYDTQWALSTNYVQSDGKSDYSYTDLAYLLPEQIDQNLILETFNKHIQKHTIPNTSMRIEQFREHIRNMNNRLGTKTVDIKFLNFWHDMSRRRNTDYINEVEPLKYLVDRYHDLQSRH